VWVSDGTEKEMGGQGVLSFCVQGFGVMQILVIWACMGIHAVSEVF